MDLAGTSATLRHGIRHSCSTTEGELAYESLDQPYPESQRVLQTSG